MPIYNDKFEIVQQHLPFLVDVTDLVPSDIPFKGKNRMHSKFLRLCVVLGLAVRPFSVTHEWTFATRHSNTDRVRLGFETHEDFAHAMMRFYGPRISSYTDLPMLECYLQCDARFVRDMKHMQSLEFDDFACEEWERFTVDQEDQSSEIERHMDEFDDENELVQQTDEICAQFAPVVIEGPAAGP